MPQQFEGARLKVDRAEKHIRELNALVKDFASDTSLYSVGFEKSQVWYVDTELVITVNKSKTELQNESALIIGDVYHNLRSALDLLWYDIVSATGLQTPWTRFPITDTRQELEGAKLSPALKKGQISRPIHDLVLDSIKPYKEGNFLLWSVEEANIIDKHQLLIPNFGLIQITGICIQNDKEVIEIRPIFTEASYRNRPWLTIQRDSFGENAKVIDQGQAALGYGFGLGHPHEGKQVLVTLNAVTKEVTRAIEAFSILVE